MKHSLTTLTLITCLHTVSLNAQTWTQKIPSFTPPRYHAAAFTIGKIGYMGTGITGCTPPCASSLQDFWAYDQSTNTWTQKTDFANGTSGSRSWAIGFSIGTKGYIGTGYCELGYTDCPFGWTPSFWEYYPATNAWTKKAPVLSAGGATIGARNDAISFSIGNKGYVGTGSDGSPSSPLADFWEYDPSSLANGLDVNGNPMGKWTQKASLPKLRNSAFGVAMGCYGYVVGGIDDLSNYLPDLWEYNPTADTWTARTPFPGAPRGEAGGFVIGNKLYYGTGYNLSTSTNLNDFWEWDQPTDTWTQLINFPGLAIGGIARSSFTIGCKGYYTGGYTAASGATAEVWEFQPAALIPLSVNLCSVNMPCSGCTGTATANATGCSPPFNYNWNSIPAQTTATATGLCPGIYTVMVTDAGGATVTATVASNGALSATTSSTQTSCAPCNGTATATPSGGTSYTYSWSTSPVQTDSTATALCAGTYSVTVNDISGCSLTQTVAVTVNNPLSVATSSTQTSCTACIGTAIATPSGGTSYTYSWNTSPVQTNDTATALCTGTYNVTVNDVSGCSLTQTVTVTANNPLTLPPPASTASACSPCTGTAIATPSGGTSYTYSWLPGGQTDSTATALCAGTYSVTVTDPANGCTRTAPAIVAQTPGPTTTASATPATVAAGGTSQLSATGTGGVNYLWSPSVGLSCVTCANPIATPTVTTTYSVTVTDGNGCMASDTAKITMDIICGEIFVPTAFSPNNDGANELECMFGNPDCITNLMFSIFDRWGEKVFETTDPKICWDGTYNGKRMNTAVFVYSLEATLASGEKITKKGNISLVR